CGPLALIAEKESEQFLFFVKYIFEPHVEYLNEHGTTVDEYNNITYEVSAAIKGSIKDYKPILKQDILDNDLPMKSTIPTSKRPHVSAVRSTASGNKIQVESSDSDCYDDDEEA
ncbi:unnamed protein product, partial [Didymodactylos carnosus]